MLLWEEYPLHGVFHFAWSLGIDFFIEVRAHDLIEGSVEFLLYSSI